MNKHVLIGGGSGFVGRYLTALLLNKGYDVTIISRSKVPKSTGQINRMTWGNVSYASSAINITFLLTVEPFLHDECRQNGLPQCEAVVNLAGTLLMNPMRRWNAAFRDDLVNSRVDTTKLLATAIDDMVNPPKAFVATSSIGYYPPSDTAEFTEDSVCHGNDFNASFLEKWENSGKVSNSITRHSIVRIGLVLGRGGGILEHSYYVFMMGLGGNLGSGRQFMSWIHAQDVAGIMCHAIESPEVSGVLNAVAPAFNTNAEYTTALAKAMNRPACLPVPKFALSAIFGPVRADVMTTGSKIWPKRTLDSGYEFLYPDLQSACHEIVNQ